MSPIEMSWTAKKERRREGPTGWQAYEGQDQQGKEDATCWCNLPLPNFDLLLLMYQWHYPKSFLSLLIFSNKCYKKNKRLFLPADSLQNHHVVTISNYDQSFVRPSSFSPKQTWKLRFKGLRTSDVRSAWYLFRFWTQEISCNTRFTQRGTYHYSITDLRDLTWNQ